MDRKIIIALIIVVLAILVGLVAFSQNIKMDTQINFLSNSSLKNGDAVEFELVDAQGNKLSNQELTIKFEGNNGTDDLAVVTNSEGKASLVLNDESSGNYTVTVSYAGDNNHNNCTAKQAITIGEGTSDAAGNVDDSASSTATSGSSQDQTQSYSSSYSSQSSSDGLNYDSELNLYYDSNGVIHGGQNDGANYEDVKNNPPVISEDGSLE